MSVETASIPKDHVDLCEAMGILDFGRAAKLSGSRFSVIQGAGRCWSGALTTFFLNPHTGRHGYQEIIVPNLVNRAKMTGTGQLPKFEENLFRTGVAGRELFDPDCGGVADQCSATPRRA